VKRRTFIALVGGAAVAWPLAARAQQRVRRIGVLMGTAESDPEQKALVSALIQALADLGWREGHNIRIEYRWAFGDADRLEEYAAELGGLGLDVIFGQGTPAVTALERQAGTTPVIFVMVTDPVGSGLVANLAKPGGKLTGFSNYEYAMGGK
jgi:putative tryptophan/tyrosine transport system substrate-binding protein